MRTLTVQDLGNDTTGNRNRKRVEAFLNLCALAEDPTRAWQRNTYITQAMGVLRKLFGSMTSNLSYFAEQVMPEVCGRFKAMLAAANGEATDLSLATVSAANLF